MMNVKGILAGALLGAAVLGGAAQAADVKVALVPGGPHPYFANWEQGGRDAMKEFGLKAADYRVPAKWELGLQNQMIENLTAQGYHG